MRVAITGGTGFIGRAVTRSLLDAGHEVVILSRDPERTHGRVDPRAGVARWSVKDRPEALAEVLEGIDGVLHLAGENVGAGRWTPERKQTLVESRTAGTASLVAAIAVMKQKPKILVSASGIGIYGNRGEEILDEKSSAGTDFLAQLSVEWERLAREAEGHGVRTVVMRIGVVLGRDGGALEKMLLPFRMFAGGPLGSGRQWFPWIHIEDIAGIVRFALENDSIRGPVNACAPGIVQLVEFCRILGKVMGRPSWLPVPAFVLKLALGEQADLVLGGQHAVPKALQQAGYQFRFPYAEAALRSILS